MKLQVYATDDCPKCIAFENWRFSMLREIYNFLNSKNVVFACVKNHRFLTAFRKNLKEAVKELNLTEEIERIDLEHAIKLNITSCPALIINGNIKSMGKLMSIEELKGILKENR